MTETTPKRRGRPRKHREPTEKRPVGRPRKHDNPTEAHRVRQETYRARRKAKADTLALALLGISERHDLNDQERKALHDAARLLGSL